jgi:hypothetical protein
MSSLPVTSKVYFIMEIIRHLSSDIMNDIIRSGFFLK